MVTLSELTSRLREAEVLMERYQDACGQVRGGRGQDATGRVAVLVDAAGRMVDIDLHPDWRRSPGPAGLPAALLQAGQDAVANRWTRVAELTADAESGPPPQPTPDHVSRPVPAPDGDAVRSRLRHALSLVDGWDARIVDVQERAADAASREYAGAGRLVRVVIDAAGQLSDVEFDDRFLTRASDLLLCDEIREAVRAAYRALDDASDGEWT